MKTAIFIGPDLGLTEVAVGHGRRCTLAVGGRRDVDEGNYDVLEGLAREETYTVLSCDIRSFTSFSESVSCSQCYRFLNSFFMVMEPGIRDFGDLSTSMSATRSWRCLRWEDGQFSDNAVRAAVSIQKQVLVDYDQGRRRAGYEPIRIGVGINTGPVAIGIAGTPERLDACAFGNTVNVAARCESLTKEFSVDTIITAETYRQLRDPDAFDMHSLGGVPVRGLEKEMQLYEVRDFNQT